MPPRMLPSNHGLRGKIPVFERFLGLMMVAVLPTCFWTATIYLLAPYFGWALSFREIGFFSIAIIGFLTLIYGILIVGPNPSRDNQST